jgi:two-component system, NtrC family, sensor kinase
MNKTVFTLLILFSFNLFAQKEKDGGIKFEYDDDDSTKKAKKGTKKNKKGNTIVYRIDTVDARGVLLNKGWKFTYGDNPDYAKTDFKDTLNWSKKDIDTEFKQFKLTNKNQIGWFRKKIFIDSALVNQPLIMTIRISGAAELYLNGKLLHKIGTISNDDSKSELIYFKERFPYSLSFDKAGEQVLALRYLLPKKVGELQDSDFYPYSINLRHVEDYSENLEKEQGQDVLDGVILGLFLMLALIHFFLYKFFNDQPYNALFGLAQILFFVYLLLPKFFSDKVDFYQHVQVTNFKSIIYHIAHLCMMLATYIYLSKPTPKLFWVLTSAFFVTHLLVLAKIINVEFVFAAYGLLLINYIIMIVIAIRNKNINGKHLRTALVIFILSIIIFFVIFIVLIIVLSSINVKLVRSNLEGNEMYFVSPFLILFMVGPQIAISGSIIFGIARQFLKTNFSLEKQLKENEKLASEKQEILYKQNEILEHQVAERTAELEASFKELKETQNQLVQREKLASLGELTAGIAHEIQNPLNFVNNFSEVSKELLEELLDERKKEKAERDETLEDEILGDIEQNLSKINHHGKRASNIVKGMLEHSRASTGEKQLTDINALADEYLRLSYHGLRAKDKSFNSDFKTELEENLPKIKAIPQDLGRVLLNLFNNAFYAVSSVGSSGTPAATLTHRSEYKPLVSVSTRRCLSEAGGVTHEGTVAKGDFIEIKISDNGTGIPESLKQKIFQPFFTTKPTGEGTGLGLSLSYDIITKGHGGTISLDSEEGVGTTFTIKLPI